MARHEHYYEGGRRFSKHADLDAAIASDFGDAYDLYRQKWKTTLRQETLPTDGFPVPLHLIVEPVDACNLNCVFCFRRNIVNSGAVMSTETFRSLIDEAKRIGVESVALTIGEPLMHPNIAEFLTAISEAHFNDVLLYTNGILMTEEIVPFILKSVTRLHVSLDAVDEDSYQRVRGGDWSLLMRNIDFFLSARSAARKKSPFFWVSFVMSEENRHLSGRFVMNWLERGDMLDLQNLVSFRDPTKLEHYPASVFRFCPDPHRQLLIKANGTISPCCMEYGPKHHSFGRFPEKGLLDAWQSERAVSLRRRLLAGDAPIVCLNCMAASAPS